MLHGCSAEFTSTFARFDNDLLSRGDDGCERQGSRSECSAPLRQVKCAGRKWLPTDVPRVQKRKMTPASPPQYRSVLLGLFTDSLEKSLLKISQVPGILQGPRQSKLNTPLPKLLQDHSDVDKEIRVVYTKFCY